MRATEHEPASGIVRLFCQSLLDSADDNIHVWCGLLRICSLHLSTGWYRCLNNCFRRANGQIQIACENRKQSCHRPQHPLATRLLFRFSPQRNIVGKITFKSLTLQIELVIVKLTLLQPQLQVFKLGFRDSNINLSPIKAIADLVTSSQ